MSERGGDEGGVAVAVEIDAGTREVALEVIGVGVLAAVGADEEEVHLLQALQGLLFGTGLLEGGRQPAELGQAVSLEGLPRSLERGPGAPEHGDPLAAEIRLLELEEKGSPVLVRDRRSAAPRVVSPARTSIARDAPMSGPAKVGTQTSDGMAATPDAVSARNST